MTINWFSLFLHTWKSIKWYFFLFYRKRKTCFCNWWSHDFFKHLCCLAGLAGTIMVWMLFLCQTHLLSKRRLAVDSSIFLFYICILFDYLLVKEKGRGTGTYAIINHDQSSACSLGCPGVTCTYGHLFVQTWCLLCFTQKSLNRTLLGFPSPPSRSHCCCPHECWIFH